MEKINVTLSATLAEAQSVVNERSNGSLTGISAGKGGRAWLEGEWCLAELEALCIVIRNEAGANAGGLMETLQTWAGLDVDEANNPDNIRPQPVYYVKLTAVKELLLELRKRYTTPMSWGITDPLTIAIRIDTDYYKTPLADSKLEGYVNLSKLCNTLRDMETSKLAGGANSGLNEFICRLNLIKEAK